MKKPQYNKGITYVEIVISLFIFVMILPMIIEVFRFINLESQNGKRTLELVYIGEAYIEELKSMSIEELNALLKLEQIEYEDYYIRYSITPYWNGRTDVIHYIVKSMDNSYTTYIFYPNKNDTPSYIVINAMKYNLQHDIFIDINNIASNSDLILYCTHDNHDKIHIDSVRNLTTIEDNSNRDKVIFKLYIEIFENSYDEVPSLLMETLFEKEI